MNRIFKILILLLAAFSLIAAFHVFSPTVAKGDTLRGNYTLLVLTVDPSEPRPGPGAVDMAFVVHVKNGTISNMTPIYPGNMTHPTASPPAELASTNNSKLYLHDTLWWNNTTYDAKLAQETVQYNTGIKTDGVVIIKPEAVDAIINAIGPIYVPGQGYVNVSSIDFLREEQKEGMSRANAVESLASAIKNASYYKSKRSLAFNAIYNQYSKGNIIVIPQSLYNQLMSEETLNKMFS